MANGLGKRERNVSVLTVIFNIVLKLIIEGDMTNRPGLLSIGALHTSDSSKCSVIPQSAREGKLTVK